jgi:hypothetical protein
MLPLALLSVADWFISGQSEFSETYIASILRVENIVTQENNTSRRFKL